MIENLISIAKDAGAEILKIYSKDDFEKSIKEDNSPLTEADLASNKVICESLKKLYPEIPILSEEIKQAPYDTRKEWSEFFLIDPLDGTKEFIKRNGEFTVNIALINKNRPVLGIIYSPALEVIYFSYKNGGSYKLNIEEDKIIENYFMRIFR